jgi:hypothetical protein
MKILAYSIMLTLFLNTAFAAEFSNGKRSILSETHDEIKHTGNLEINDSKLKTLKTTGSTKIAKSNIVNIKNTGNLKIKHSEVTFIDQIGNAKLKNLKLKIIKINGNLKVKNSNIESIECVDKCEITIKKSEIKEIKFTKKQGLIKADDKSRISKLTNCTILS